MTTLDNLSMDEINTVLPLYSGKEVDVVVDPRMHCGDIIVSGSAGHGNVWARAHWVGRSGWRGAIVNLLRADGSESMGELWSCWENLRVVS